MAKAVTLKAAAFEWRQLSIKEYKPLEGERGEYGRDALEEEEELTDITVGKGQRACGNRQRKKLVWKW